MWRQALAVKGVGLVQLGTIASALAGERIFPMLGMPMPEFVASLQENKLGSCMAAWMMGNIVSQNLIATGAYRNEEAHRLPSGGFFGWGLGGLFGWVSGRILGGFF